MPAFTQRDLTLLIVEDEEHVARYLREALKNLFVHVECVESLTETKHRLSDASSRQVDCLLMDLNLTNGRGLIPIQEIRSKYPFLPIVVMTGGDTTADESMAAGACDFLHKTDMGPRAVYNAVVKSVARRKSFQIMAPMLTTAANVKAAIQEGKGELSRVVR